MARSRPARAAGSRFAVMAALAGIFGGLFAAPALAADFTAVLQISKTVQDATLTPGPLRAAPASRRVTATRCRSR